MKRSLLIPLFTLFILFSCKKEVPEIIEDEPKITATTVFAGVSDSTFYFFEFINPVEINITWDNLNLYGFGKDSIDINNDGNFDLTFELSILNEDSLHLLTGMPSPFPYLRLDNNIDIALYSESFYIGLGQTATATFADAIDYGSRIDSIQNWEINPHSYIRMWNENPNNGMTPPFGKWYYINTVKYLGIRLNNKYGWIEIDATNQKNPLITKFAIQL